MSYRQCNSNNNHDEENDDKGHIPLLIAVAMVVLNRLVAIAVLLVDSSQ